jgi:hypothetical protein
MEKYKRLLSFDHILHGGDEYEKLMSYDHHYTKGGDVTKSTAGSGETKLAEQDTKMNTKHKKQDTKQDTKQNTKQDTKQNTKQDSVSVPPPPFLTIIPLELMLLELRYAQRPYGHYNNVPCYRPCKGLLCVYVCVCVYMCLYVCVYVCVHLPPAALADVLCERRKARVRIDERIAAELRGGYWAIGVRRRVCCVRQAHQRKGGD